jgi:hypothetical protein
VPVLVVVSVIRNATQGEDKEQTKNLRYFKSPPLEHHCYIKRYLLEQGSASAVGKVSLNNYSNYLDPKSE